MKVTLSIEFADGSKVNATATTKDLSAFEETYDKAFVSGVSLRIKELGWLAWHALNRRGQAPGDFDAWWANVEDVEVGEGEDVAPLESAAPTGS